VQDSLGGLLTQEDFEAILQARRRSLLTA